VYSPHAFPFLQRVAFPLRWTYAALERALARHTDFLLAVSAAEGRLAAEMGLYRPTRVHVLPNALNVEQLDRQVGPLMEVPEPGVGRTFAFLGELRKQKDPDTFLQAALLLRERGVAARFVMPARGHDLERIQAYLDRHHLRSIVELIPAESSLTALHLKGHVGVLPSRWEGLPYTVLEALALRHPVVASGLPVFEDLLRPLDQRLLFPAGDSRALAERLELWAGMPSRELAEVGERARTLVVEEYDFCSWQKGLRRIYRAILGPRKDGETPGVVEP
jgi:glycosyltransferase involved in cell wall biosynthesis